MKTSAKRRTSLLLVDDDDDFAEAATLFLHRHGFDVRRARSGREGVDAARTAPPEIVLMDVMMEERTAGFFAIQQMRRDPRLERVPILVVSSIWADVPGFRVTPEADWLRHDGFLAKPVDFDALLATVRALLGSSKQAAARPA